MRKIHLEEILDTGVERWRLEYAINDYMYVQGRKVQWAPHSGINTGKLRKRGLLKGLFGEIRMYANILTEAGILNLLRHMLFFAQERVEHRNGVT
jgi:hypothetical protein